MHELSLGFLTVFCRSHMKHYQTQRAFVILLTIKGLTGCQIQQQTFGYSLVVIYDNILRPEDTCTNVLDH